MNNLLLDRGMSQSDLARIVYGKTRVDSRGYEVVVGKDRISSYVRGLSKPEPRVLKKIAEAFGMTPEELAPDIAAGAVERANPDLQVTSLAGHHDKVLLKINKLLPLSLAAKIVALISEFEESR